jgi:hypothetical protein
MQVRKAGTTKSLYAGSFDPVTRSATRSAPDAL